MKIQFDEGGFIEIKASSTPSKVDIILAAVDYDNPLKKIINSVEIDGKDFFKLVNSVKLSG